MSLPGGKVAPLLDRTILCGVIALLFATPLIEGAVEPWGVVAAETAIFLLFALAMLRVIAAGAAEMRFPVPESALALLFCGIVAMQLIPLPPMIIRMIAPSTFELYRHSIAGWPLDPGYPGAAGPIAAMLPATWRPLAIAPQLSAEALLKLLAYLCLLAIIAGTGSGQLSGRSRRLCATIVLAALVVAIAALLAEFFPSDKVIGIFTPYDWGRSNPWGMRAVGPFVNPDHLAAYLDLALPLAVVGGLMPSALGRRRTLIRTVSVAALLLIASALILTSSRAGMLGAIVGGFVLLRLWPGRLAGREFSPIALAAGALTLLAAVILIVGPAGRMQVNSRLAGSVEADSFSGRLEPALESLAIVRDFPLSGVGMGSWPEIFPRYRRPPWTPAFWNAAHNDYVQLAAEAGVPALLIALAFAVGMARRILHGIRRLGGDSRALAAGCVAGMSAAVLHEFFDFPLRVPANAILFVVLLGVALRLTRSGEPRVSHNQSGMVRIVAALGLAAAGLVWIVRGQGAVPYPYNLRGSTSAAATLKLLSRYPAHSRLHLRLLAQMGDRAPIESQERELRAAVWLDPTNPLARDLYVLYLEQRHQEKAALAQITRSVAGSPELANHFYLTPALIHRLDTPEREAVARGFAQALAEGEPASAENFAGYEEILGNFDQAANLYLRAAARNPEHRVEYLDSAASAYATGGERIQAEALFRRAIAAAPTDAAPYEGLIERVYAPSANLAAAKALVVEGIGRGADPWRLYSAEAAASEFCGDFDQAEAALQQAIALRPGNYATVMHLGHLELVHGRFDRAAKWLGQATALEPDSAEAFKDLGRAEEAAYEYFAADRAYRRAIELAPDDTALRAHYAAFREKIVMSEQLRGH